MLTPPKIMPVHLGGERPLWSVMIPTFNRTTYLRRTLESVLAQDPGRSRHKHHVGMSCPLELRNQLAKRRAKVGRGKDRQGWGRRLGPGLGGRKKGRDEGQPHE